MPHKILLYSHDSWGLGHLRRSLAIARRVCREIPDTSCLIATGSPVATSFGAEFGVEIVKLPSVTKGPRGAYQPRQLRGSYADTLRLRREILSTVFAVFEPDVLLVDHQMTGLSGELESVLRAAKARGTYCIYGMRDVLDSQSATEREWSTNTHRWALQEAFDRIWVYGDGERFDTVAAYPSLHTMRTRVTYTGLIQSGERLGVHHSGIRKRVLVTAGGGEDGGHLLETYMQGLRCAAPSWHSTIVAGPLLEDRKAAALQVSVDDLEDTEFHRFHPSIPSLLENCDAVVSMAGYNSCAEIVAARRPAVLVPRTKLRQEQLIRARYLTIAGVATYLVDPSPTQLMRSVTTALSAGPPEAIRYPRCDGLDVVAREVAEILRDRNSVPRRISKERIVS